MIPIDRLDTFFEYFSSHFVELLPDGIVDIDADSLRDLQLLSDTHAVTEPAPANHLLQAIESSDKVTLFNDRFALWIVPQKDAQPPSTITFIARCTAGEIKPEVGFRTTGVYNRSRTILRLIDRFLHDIQETESVLSNLEKVP